ncbi:hypothetical protein [Sphingomonas bacterium]|uniref:hypothetical protein n=1 Tax=Sphingomonas bacterium TaxID=1895847 RepID=UPI0015767CC2|nr:hypothetical protein [Sphingomonas bacterium]
MTMAEARTLIQTAHLPSAQAFAADAPESGGGLPSFDAARDQALVVGSDVVSFTTGVEAEFRQAITDSSLFSQLVAIHKVGDDADPMAFFNAYFETLLGLGWIEQQRETAAISLDSGGFDVHQAVIGVISTFLAPVAGPAALVAVVAVLNGLHQINADQPFITLFDKRTRHGRIGRFQITSVRHDPAQGLMAEVMAFALVADEVITQVLFFKLHKGSTELRRSFGSLSVDAQALAGIRPNLAAKVGAFRTAFIAEADLGSVPGGK